jgi:riboflavin biosynthesis pyrimidine reductase
VLFIAPKLIGRGGVPLLDLDGPARMADAWRLTRVRARRLDLGGDIVLVGDVVPQKKW